LASQNRESNQRRKKIKRGNFLIGCFDLGNNSREDTIQKK
jgi:hypothetical protein